MSENKLLEAPDAYVKPFNDREQVAGGARCLCEAFLMREIKPLEAPDAYVKPFKEREQSAGGSRCLCEAFYDREQATGGS